jgi:hypothetical protein
MLILNKYFYNNIKSKLCIGDRVAVLNDMFYEYIWREYKVLLNSNIHIDLNLITDLPKHSITVIMRHRYSSLAQKLNSQLSRFVTAKDNN